jgi:hypothetical protein
MNTYSVSFQGVILSIWGNSVQVHLGAAHIATLYLAVLSDLLTSVSFAIIALP